MSNEREPATTWGWDTTGPIWGAQAFPPGGGQDHLGLGSVSSDRILPRLSPGINVLTIHPRYWSFYAFVLDEFWARDLRRTTGAFREFYHPCEAMFAFACQICQAPEHATVTGNIVGSRRTAAVVEKDEEFDPRFDYIKEPLGGYGLYYRSVMEEAGLLVVADPATGFAFDALTSAGRGLADAYRAAISDTRLYRDYLSDTDVPVPRDVLIEFGAAGCLCQLRVAAPDLPLLQDMFLHAGEPLQSKRRRGTLRFLLDICRTAQTEPINEDRYRQLIYFRSVGGDEYVPRKGTATVARRWRLYQAREYFAYSFNRLWAWLARRGLQLSDDGLVAVPIEEIWATVTHEFDNNQFAAELGLPDPGINSATAAQVFGTWLTDQVDVTPGVNAVWRRHDVLDEHALYTWCDNAYDDAETLVAMLAMLLLLYHRVGRPGRLAELHTDMDLLGEGDSLRIGMARFFNQLHKRLLAGRTLGDLARWIFTDFIITQHERVATAKLPEDTFRFRRVGESLRFFDQGAPVRFNGSRFVALSTVAHELGLVSSLAQPRRRLTAAGRRLLEHGDLPTGALVRAAQPYEHWEQG